MQLYQRLQRLTRITD